MSSNSENIRDVLRQRAELLLSAGKNSVMNLESDEVKKIFHERQIHQLELEMQNDELQYATGQLEEQRIKFTNLFELAPVGYFVTNKSGIILDVNHAGLKLLKAEKNNVVNKPLLLYVHKEHIDVFYKYFRKLFLLQNAQSCQIRMTDSDQQVYNVQVEGIALGVTSDQPICYLTVTDFTGKQQAELNLDEAKKRLEIALSASLTGIWEIDIITGKVYLDDFCCGLCGFENGVFDQKYDSLLNRIHQNDRKNVDDQIRKTILYGKEFNMKFRVTVIGASVKYVFGRAQVIKDQNGKKRFIGTFTDISDKTITELETNRAKESQQQMILAAGLQAEENEKKRISEVLHNSVAQMLYAIKLNLEQIKKPDESASFDYINQLLNQSIKEIRNISFELAPSILTDFGLTVTLEDMASRLCSDQLKVTTKVSKFDQPLDFQLQLNIFRIVQELVSNSIKHAFCSEIYIETSNKNKNIYITVFDNGIGYRQAKAKEVPSGIGLSSIKNRLRLYKGTLKIESQPKAGTKVKIHLKY